MRTRSHLSCNYTTIGNESFDSIIPLSLPRGFDLELFDFVGVWNEAGADLRRFLCNSP